MRNPIRLVCILLLSMLPSSMQAQRILVVGVRQRTECEFATRPLQADLRKVSFPKDWTLLVACNSVAWQNLRRRADALQTNTAFTNMAGHLTVLNGAIYRDMPPLRGTAFLTPSGVLKHELGHIVCACNDEFQADRAGNVR